ncbi:pitrilysin family protein [Microlunatus sp. Gsoil 973]|uniref:M16 family metallopeptidase n=1 Tax=Microlunatus sp. Gsoil 973 TaxID=2672569 RepID=UPI0012B49FAF|nr:pitrilysin family protein [Microlunatus sp. Gsoil 973]QGN32221.1 insulinase family protein [Microlunatus sp. Gsoil 973]
MSQPTAFTPAPRPEIAEPRPWSFPTPDRTTLDNGLEVISYRLPGQHVISASLVLDVPLTAEPRELEGVAAITCRTLDEGTTEHGTDEFAELLETAGAGFGVDVSSAGLQLILDVPSRHLDAALDLFAEAISTPALAAPDIDRQVQLRLAEISQARANPSQAAAIAFRRKVFADGTRYARMNDGEPETVAAVTAEAAQRFHRDHFGPRDAKLILAGELPEGVESLVHKHFGGWFNEQQSVVDHQPPQPGVRRAVIVHRPGSVQADLQLGGFGIDRTDPRWADISVASYIMGGAFLSRLNGVLREQLGYTYGVRMGFQPLRSGGTFAVSGSFRTEVIGDALTRARTLLSISEQPFTQQEVSDAVTYFTGVSPLRYATADGVVDQAAIQALALLPDDYLDQRLAKLRDVTPQSAGEAYRSLVDPEQLTLAIAGDADKITGPLTEAGFADIEIIDLET